MIKKLSLLSLILVFSTSVLWAQTTVFAYVKDASGNIVENADVDLSGQDARVSTDKIGYFQFVDLKPGSYQVIISKINFETKVLTFDVADDEKRKDLGVIQLNAAMHASDTGVTLLDDTSSDDDGGSMQATIGLLNSGRDAFQNVTAFELGAYWFRPRGVDNRFEDVLFNGVSMSKNDDGKIDFSNWGGLNDVTRYPFESVDNITPSEYTFGNLGGVVYYNTRASTYRKQVSLAYSFTNRSYLHRAMATISTGLSKSGWAFTFSGSRRWAEEGTIEGTQQDSYAYFGSIEKQFSDRHSINLTAFGSPTYRASNAPNTQEVYDLMGKDYNSYWGWQDGEKRNSRIRRTFEPIFMLTDYLKLGKTSNWINTVSYQFGSDSRSRLDWFHGSDPNPTYYRKLPSYWKYKYANFLEMDPTSPQYEYASQFISDLTDSWKNDSNVSQIDWTSLYNSNLNNLERGALYTMVEDVNEDKTINFSSHFDTKLQSNWKLNLNFNYQNLKSDNFRRIADLLGANYANNQDAFNNDKPFDQDATDTKVYVGDRTQYSYLLTRQSYALNASTEIDTNKWNILASIFGSYSESQREGDFRNALYVNNSKGKSNVYDFLDSGIKAKVTYKINGKNFIVYNGAFFSLAPTLNEIFVNPRVSDFTTPDLRNQIINSNDLSYIVRGQILKMRLTGYWTEIQNATEVSRYYAEGIQYGDVIGSQNAFVAEIMTGVHKRYKGVELGMDVKVLPTLNVLAVASVGEYTYENNPNVYLSADSDKLKQGFESLGKAAMKGYKISSTPQKGFSLGLKYNSPKYWWVGASANYLMDQYLDISPLNRTANFYTNPLTGDNYEAVENYNNGGGLSYDVPEVTQERVQELLKQRKFDNQFMLNANAGKSFLIGKYRMGISVSVNNILNNRNYVTGGFEQGRRSNFRDAYVESQQETSLFGPKLWYDRGTTFFANVYLRF